MLRPKNLTDIYVWVIVFDDGRVVTQLGNNQLSKENRIDVNRPPESLGRPFRIVLLPRRPHLPLLHWRIPEGCRPFYAAANMMRGNQAIGFQYLVGYVQGQHRTYYSVNPETGVAERKEDDDG